MTARLDRINGERVAAYSKYRSGVTLYAVPRWGTLYWTADEGKTWHRAKGSAYRAGRKALETKVMANGWQQPDYAVTPEYIACDQCPGNPRKQVTGTKVTNQRQDATEVYRLACGHVVM